MSPLICLVAKCKFGKHLQAKNSTLQYVWSSGDMKRIKRESEIVLLITHRLKVR